MAHLRLLPFVALSFFLAAGCGVSHVPDDGGGDDGATRVDSGGSDAGSDAPAPLDAGLDAPWESDGATPSCAADDAQAITCPSAVCDGLDSYAWDGEQCVRIDCGTCTGTACASLARSETECRARHAACVPELCRSTGGDWLFFAEECHHFRCGRPQPAECFVGMPVCDCGVGRSFVDGTGCAADPTCGVVDPLPPDVLCAATHGTWTAGICCASHCGQACPLDCAAPACTCGRLQVFDAVRGCIDTAECHVRAVGEVCGGGAVRCGAGLLCCAHCGGAGCAPDMTCEAPVCDADPHTDECGNNLLAP